MRDQGVAANATPRVVRGHSKAGLKPCRLPGRPSRLQVCQPGDTYEGDRRRPQAAETHQGSGRTAGSRPPGKWSLRAGIRWRTILERQGEIVLAGEVHDFANHLPRVMTDRERLAEELVQRLKARRAAERGDDKLRAREQERTR